MSTLYAVWCVYWSLLRGLSIFARRTAAPCTVFLVQHLGLYKSLFQYTEKAERYALTISGTFGLYAPEDDAGEEDYSRM